MSAARGSLAASFAILWLAGCTPVAAPPAPPPLAPPLMPKIVGNADFHLIGPIEQGGAALGKVPAGTASLSFDGQPIAAAPDGRFLIGFDRDHGPEAKLEAVLADGTILRRSVPVPSRSWKLESLPTLPKGTTPTPEFLVRRKAEQAMIAAARATATNADGWRQSFTWPVPGRISGEFGSQRIYAGEPGAYHSGLDIARPEGTPVAAPADGVVILAAPSPFTLEGNLLMIDHGMGLNSAFLHLSRIDVKVGDTIRQGQVVGAIGATGRATGPHLHWSIKWRDARIDPERVIWLGLQGR